LGSCRREGVLGGVELEKQFPGLDSLVLLHRDIGDDPVHSGQDRSPVDGLGLTGGGHGDPEGIPHDFGPHHRLRHVSRKLLGGRLGKDGFGVGGLRRTGLFRFCPEAVVDSDGQCADDDDKGQESEDLPRELHPSAEGEM
jgi:hypothetical protein